MLAKNRDTSRRWMQCLSYQSTLGKIAISLTLPFHASSFRNLRVMKNLLLKHIKLSLGLIGALLFSSCLQNETTINLNKDGSGTIVEETILGAQMLEMMTQFAQPGQPDPIADMFSDEKAKEKAAKMGEGVEFVKAEMIDGNGKKGARVHYKFADINTLNVSPSSAVESLGPEAPPAEGEDKKEDFVKFKYADGKLTLITPPTDFEDMTMPEEAEQNAEMEEMMTKMMADMRMTLKISFPGGIEKTNATHVDGNTITIVDMQVGKVFAQKEAMKKITETAKTDVEAAKAEFGKLDGIKMELKEGVTVSLK